MNRVKLSEEQEQQILQSLFDFVIRVSAGKETSGVEATALHDVAKLLLDYYA